MAYDLSKLRDLQSKNKNSPVVENLPPISKANNTDGEKDVKSEIRQNLTLEGEKREREQMRAVYRKYQDAIKKTELLQAEILKGYSAGQDPEALFLKAAECVSLATGNAVFYKTVLNVAKKRREG